MAAITAVYTLAAVALTLRVFEDILHDLSIDMASYGRASDQSHDLLGATPTRAAS